MKVHAKAAHTVVPTQSRSAEKAHRQASRSDAFDRGARARPLPLPPAAPPTDAQTYRANPVLVSGGVPLRGVKPLPPIIGGSMKTPAFDNRDGTLVAEHPGDFPSAAEAEKNAVGGHGWRDTLRADDPGAGSVGFPKPSIDYSQVTDLKSLSQLEYDLIMQMRTTQNPKALYDEARAQVGRMPPGELRDKYERFVNNGGGDCALRFGYWIRQSTPNGWAEGTYVPPAPNTLGDLAHGGRSLEDFHAYDWLQNSKQLEEHFHFKDAGHTPKRSIRLCNNAYRLPQAYLMQYLQDINGMSVEQTRR